MESAPVKRRKPTKTPAEDKEDDILIVAPSSTETPAVAEASSTPVLTGPPKRTQPESETPVLTGPPKRTQPETETPVLIEPPKRTQPESETPVLAGPPKSTEPEKVVDVKQEPVSIKQESSSTIIVLPNPRKIVFDAAPKAKISFAGTATFSKQRPEKRTRADFETIGTKKAKISFDSLPPKRPVGSLVIKRDESDSKTPDTFARRLGVMI